MTLDFLRLVYALALVAAWCALCYWAFRRSRRGAGASAQWLVAYASQTGAAETLAVQTVATLRTAGLSAQSLPLNALGEAQLRGAERILFIASTFGEGDPPDNALRFAERILPASLPLAHLHYAVLALGDKTYEHYCGFARTVDAWLATQGAQPLFDRIEVDRGDVAAIESWQEHLCHLSGASDVDAWTAPPFRPWRVAERVLLNAGSAGAPVYRIALQPADGAMPPWEAGDLVQVSAPAEPDLPREFSIASVPAEGCIELLVRLHLRPDGSKGVASSWLCEGAGSEVALRMRPHRRFRLEGNAGRPLVLVGNGTGMAGLRAHLRARIDAGETRNWLVFGERNGTSDFHYRDDIMEWQALGLLQRADVAFSRDQAEKRYVQHLLRERGSELREWVEQGAAIYVCGSLRTMAAGVHEALVAVLGQSQVDALADAGRYRRDVY